ncbi:hypothetical protein EDC14_102627 [Hydrogenispora ethanolica]|uniref:Uncharacterized protein n=1 Tax=Hydrogenispora ethanolica TaxID=1082276 RepID=A0A4R1R9A3_HYDET|nr:DUF6338 family protein [Hydrogenispora ethanolica]TCL62284.1 hypothetical protein EDC14_102627 [Hydrogenispora ethanolica]
MSELDSATKLFLVIAFILPGFVAYSVSNSLYRKPQPKRDFKEIEITYSSIFYSCGMYAVLYAILGKSLLTLIPRYPLWSAAVMIVLSFLWGIAVFLIRIHDLLYRVLRRLGLMGKITPPNLYAAVFDPNYSPEASAGRWVTVKLGQRLLEGYVELADVAEDERLILIKGIREFTEDGEFLNEPAEGTGIIIDLTKVDSITLI